MLKIHCQVCDAVIGDQVERLVLECGRGVGSVTFGCTEDNAIDVCVPCAKERPADVIAIATKESGLAVNHNKKLSARKTLMRERRQ